MACPMPNAQLEVEELEEEGGAREDDLADVALTTLSSVRECKSQKKS